VSNPDTVGQGIGQVSQDPVVQAAIEWMVLLRSGNGTAQEAAAFDDWRRSDPLHDQACRRIEQTLGCFDRLSAVGVQSHTARAALTAPSSRRRVLGQLLGLGAIGVGVGVLGLRLPPVRMALADVHTAVGQRQSLDLDSGSRVILNARTALNMGMSGGRRLLTLVSGEVLVSHSSGPELIVRSAEGLFQCDNGRFSVRQDSGSTRVNVLEGLLRVRALNDDLAGTTFLAGQTFDIGSQGNRLLADRSPYAETAWVDGKLQVNDRTLAEVVAALDNYRPGFIRLAPELASLRISGSFPLDDTDHVLSTLEQVMPVVVRRISPYWISIEAA
jgi:transmembrane sensor